MKNTQKKWEKKYLTTTLKRTKAKTTRRKQLGESGEPRHSAEQQDLYLPNSTTSSLYVEAIRALYNRKRKNYEIENRGRKVRRSAAKSGE